MGEKSPMRIMINRLIEWLKAKGFNGDEITECIEYITQNN